MRQWSGLVEMRRKHCCIGLLLTAPVALITLYVMEQEVTPYKFSDDYPGLVQDAANRTLRQFGIYRFAASDELATGEKSMAVVKEDIRQAVQTCLIPPLKNIQLAFDYGRNTENYKCDNKTSLGGAKQRYAISKHRYTEFLDGDKWICYDPDLAPDPHDCLVYSFGINNEWSFDDTLDRYGCEVFSFDPTMNRNNYHRGRHISFKNLGLAGYKGTLPRRKKSQVDTLGNIMRSLGHEDRRIDYLKMDIEGSEVQALEHVLSEEPHLLTQVSQLSIEVHPGRYHYLISGLGKRSKFYRVWRMYHLLECLGFQLLHMSPNAYPGTHYQYQGTLQSCCYELVWVMPPPTNRPLS